jgi:hypothetical protein
LQLKKLLKKDFPQGREESPRAAAKRGRRLRIMFGDEARFGRMNRPRPCWAPIGIRPEVAYQLIREYVYLYGAVSPKDGTCIFLFSGDLGDEILQDPAFYGRRRQSPQRRTRDPRQYHPASAPPLFARIETLRKISGMKFVKRYSRTTLSNP